MEKDARTTGWLNTKNGLVDAEQIKFSENFDRANHRFADVSVRWCARLDQDAYCPRSTETEKPTSSGLISSLERSRSGSTEVHETREVVPSSGRGRETSGARVSIEDRTSTSPSLAIWAEPTTTRCFRRPHKLSRKSCTTSY
jgi:hypothetical protein